MFGFYSIFLRLSGKSSVPQMTAWSRTPCLLGAGAALRVGSRGALPTPAGCSGCSQSHGTAMPPFPPQHRSPLHSWEPGRWLGHVPSGHGVLLLPKCPVQPRAPWSMGTPGEAHSRPCHLAASPEQLCLAPSTIYKSP